MAEPLIKRSVRFVSLDTHPASSSLVITYEILVTVTEPTSEKELTRRSKRDQFRINISALDRLNEQDLKQFDGGRTPGALNIQEINEQILLACPILLDAGDSTKVLEDIQLNLLYLLNRRQAQLTQPLIHSRPASSTRALLKSNGAPSLGRRQTSARTGSAAEQRTLNERNAQSTKSPMEIFTMLYDKYQESTEYASEQYYELVDEFVHQMDNYLNESELGLSIERLREEQMNDLDSQLEGLYGDLTERRLSIAVIRRFVSDDDERLMVASSNRLLICALLRTLRDNEGTRNHQIISESILYCLIRFTLFEDVLEQLNLSGSNSGGSLDDSPLDLVKVVIDLLERQVQWLSSSELDAAGACADLKQILANFYYTNSLLIILNNLSILDQQKDKQTSHSTSSRVVSNTNNKFKKILIEHHGNKLAETLTNLLALFARHFVRDTRTPRQRYERLTVTLRLVTEIAKQLATFKEFVLLVRTAPMAQLFVESSINLLNTLQLCRPTSGASQQATQQESLIVNDRATLLEIYELELELIQLITNLLYDTKLGARFIRKNLLLKCVLRNLVVFLAASRKSNTLRPFDCSPILLIPFKCLYELSCNNKIKSELFKSKIIAKCLLEYLLCLATDLKLELDVVRLSSNAAAAATATAIDESLDLHDDDQIVLEASQAGHSILGLWLNLSAHQTAPIYHLSSSEEELKVPLCDYFQLVANQINYFIQLVSENNKTLKRQPTRALHLNVYLHAKLFRNLSQFVAIKLDESTLEKLAQSCVSMLNQLAIGRYEFVPLTVESLATLANFLNKGQANTSEQQGEMANFPPEIGQILIRLFANDSQLAQSVARCEADNDDLLLVAINLLGALAKNKEICTELGPISDGILNILNTTIEIKQTDSEMLVCCLFTLRQLMSHFSFLHEIASDLDEPSGQSLSLINTLSLLVMHSNLSVVKLANSILDLLKQLEEAQSLSESVTCKQRFVVYNNKWLEAMRTSRDDPTRDDLDAVYATATAAASNDVRQPLENREDDEDDGSVLMDYNQLRTITETDVNSLSSSRMSTSSSLHDESGHSKVRAVATNALNVVEDDDDEDEFKDEKEVDEDDDSFSEPDFNVIDANSMIKHLTHRREFRTELLRR